MKKITHNLMNEKPHNKTHDEEKSLTMKPTANEITHKPHANPAS